ncbi:MAG: DUF1569 domain-containing protein [Ginsengibacter sp.]
MKKLKSLINQLESNFGNIAYSNPAISKGSVGWHIDHTLLTTNAVIKAIEKSNPAEYKSKFSFVKFYILTSQKIPRARIEAPAQVRPIENFTDEDVRNHFKICYDSIKKLDAFKKNNFFPHPFFGHLNLKPSIKFLEIHTRHHLRIINDILKADKL